MYERAPTVPKVYMFPRNKGRLVERLEPIFIQKKMPSLQNNIQGTQPLAKLYPMVQQGRRGEAFHVSGSGMPDLIDQRHFMSVCEAKQRMMECTKYVPQGA